MSTLGEQSFLLVSFLWTRNDQHCFSWNPSIFVITKLHISNQARGDCLRPYIAFFHLQTFPSSPWARKPGGGLIKTYSWRSSWRKAFLTSSWCSGQDRLAATDRMTCMELSLVWPKEQTSRDNRCHSFVWNLSPQYEPSRESHQLCVSGYIPTCSQPYICLLVTWSVPKCRSSLEPPFLLS